MPLWVQVSIPNRLTFLPISSMENTHLEQTFARYSATYGYINALRLRKIQRKTLSYKFTTVKQQSFNFQTYIQNTTDERSDVSSRCLWSRYLNDSQWKNAVVYKEYYKNDPGDMMKDIWWNNSHNYFHPQQKIIKFTCSRMGILIVYRYNINITILFKANLLIIYDIICTSKTFLMVFFLRIWYFFLIQFCSLFVIGISYLNSIIT